MATLAGCGHVPRVLLPNEATEPVDSARFELLARLVHLSDSQIIDEESPARLVSAAGLVSSAWRPQEAYSTQLLDGMVRTVNRLHVARGAIDFLLFTGDAADNSQVNEVAWFLAVMDGGRVDPRSGPDDRDPASIPVPLVDPHHPFGAQGLYRQGIHGPRSTIPWYTILGNHDHFALGVFPIVRDLLGRRIAPLPLSNRVGLFYPVILDPVGRLAWGPITPARPAPPDALILPELIEANPDRAYITDAEFLRALLASGSEPAGHGFDAEAPERTWYSVTPVPGLRLIGLNSASPPQEVPAGIYSEGALDRSQIAALERELQRADERGEWVIVATHHPALSLDWSIGTAVNEQALVALLNRHPSVKLHLAGHLHEHLVIDRGGYVEIVTSSILDAPQEGRVIEIWRAREPPGEDNDGLELRYYVFSHLLELSPPDETHEELFDDPLRPMREDAFDIATRASGL